MSGLLNMLSSALGGGGGNHGHSHDGGHGHSHGGGHGHAHDDHGHSHGGQGGHGHQCSGHGHSHGGQESDHGHSHAGGAHGHEEHGHSHGDGQQCNHAHELPPLPPHTGPLQTSGDIDRVRIMHVFQRFFVVFSAPEGKQKLRDAVARKEEPESATQLVLKQLFQTVGVEGEFGVQYLRQFSTPQGHQKDPNMWFMYMRLVQFESMVCDEAELSPEEFQKKLETFRANQARAMAQQQGHDHGHGDGDHGHSHGPQQPRAPAMDDAERQRIIEAARKAQEQMAKMTPEQRTKMAAAAQKQMLAVKSANPNMSPPEMARLVSEKMMNLQKLVSDYGIESPELTGALEKLDIAIKEQVGAGGLLSAPAAAAAAPVVSGPPKPAVLDDLEDELTMRPTVDRS
eukprot:m.223063 g.223063  ORF g.223063 m.223063 type:complete len:398 (-) comp10868_c0_seq1:55-1248(-)